MPANVVPVPADADDVVRMAHELIRIPAENPPGDCGRIAERILSELRSFGIDRIETHEFHQAMPNFIIQTGDEGNGGHLVIGGHMTRCRFTPTRSNRGKSARSAAKFVVTGSGRAAWPT